MENVEDQSHSAVAARRVVVGLTWAVVSMVMFSITPILVRFLSTEMHAVEIIFHRSLFGVIALGAFFLWTDVGRLRTGVLKVHVGRGLLNFIGMALWFQAIMTMPLAEATAIHFTLPLYTVMLAALFLGETVGWRRWSATLIGFAGVILVLRPGVVEIGTPALMVLASAGFYAGAVVMIKLLTRTDNALAMSFYSNLFMGLFAAIPLIFLWQGPGWDDVPLLFLLAVIGTAAPYCFTRGLHLLDASLMAPMDFLRLPFTALIAWLVFTEIPDIWTWVGAAVIFTSTTYIARREARLKHRPQARGGAAR